MLLIITCPVCPKRHKPVKFTLFFQVNSTVHSNGNTEELFTFEVKGAMCKIRLIKESESVSRCRK